ncbi:MAG TPA: 16S rRNA (guanine(527)-N(7))-methyltransferase RsmG [Solirubrobacterales bacterium]|nr:16S rRNA (guanine(527)-N(7))-methyltransferase RsmG [Solirubrobacterales bacterium]
MSPDPTGSLSDAQRRSLQTVLALLAAERASVSSVTEDRAWKVHVEDSLTGLDVPQLRKASRIADIGSGAGFPGLVLAVALPDASVDMIESVGRKTAFIKRAAAEAGIGNATAITARAEDVARADPPAGGRESYDVVTARAVGRLSTLAELASPLLKEGGVLVAWKGKRDEDEERQMDRASTSLAMTPEQILDVGHRAGSEHRHLHVLRKSAPTPPDLPRKSGIAKKRPRG